MEKDVIISIQGMQNYEGQDPDAMELVRNIPNRSSPAGISPVPRITAAWIPSP